MKWTLLLLLALNLVVGGFVYWQSTQPAGEDIAALNTEFNNLGLTSSQEQRLNASAKSTPVVANKPASKCIRITGLDTDDALSVVELRLKAWEVSATRETRQVVLYTQYQVIVGPYASADLARAELQSINASGVSGDQYVLADGKYKNAIAFGVFNSESSANNKANELITQNISANVVRKDALGNATSLVIDKASADLIKDESLSSMLSAYKDAEFSRFQCN